MSFPSTVYTPYTVAPTDARNLADVSHITLSQHLNAIETELQSLDTYLFPQADFNTRVYLDEDFVTGTQSGSYGWAFTSGTGGTTALAAAGSVWYTSNVAAGVFLANTTTTANSFAQSVISGGGLLPTGQGVIELWIRLGVSVTSIPNNTVFAGLNDNPGSNQIAVGYSGSSWVSYLRAAGTVSSVALPTQPASYTANSLITFRIVIAANLSSVTYYGVTSAGTVQTLLGTVTTGIPSAAMSAPAIVNVGAATSNACTLAVDRFRVYALINR